MPLIDNFDGTQSNGWTLTVITEDGVGTTVPIHGIDGLTPPARDYKEDVYTPISGSRAYKEQVLACSALSGTWDLRLTYEAEHQAAMDAICGTNASEITAVAPDGMTFVGRGFMKKLGMDSVDDAKRITASVTLRCAAGWSFTDGESVTLVPTYTVTTSSGTATIDLTACGEGGDVNLTGKRITRLVLTAAADNGAVITVAEGASNGYDIGNNFTITLLAGQSITIEGTAASDTVDATHKILDVTGTGADDVSVTIEAVTPS